MALFTFLRDHVFARAFAWSNDTVTITATPDHDHTPRVLFGARSAFTLDASTDLF